MNCINNNEHADEHHTSVCPKRDLQSGGGARDKVHFPQPHLQPLNLADLVKKKQNADRLFFEVCECLLCTSTFNFKEQQNEFLTHLLLAHRLVIAEVDQIGDMIKYVNYWRERLSGQIRLGDICFEISTNTGVSDQKDLSERFYLLSDDLPEDRTLREKLNIFKLQKAISQQETERNDKNYFRECLFCSESVGNNRANLINHMSTEHNFSIGHADNIVFFEEFYQKLRERFDGCKCLYCEKVFYDKQTLKEHMRKKQHKCINPLNKEFDKFYIINYLEYSKVWQDIKSERDADMEESFDNIMDDWNDPVQTYFCLFCEEFFDAEEKILGHMSDAHHFNLKCIINDHKLSFYHQIKLINYIRRQSLSGTCFVCSHNCGASKEALVDHLSGTDHSCHFPDRELWDQPEYLFSTFEDDSLLCLLDDSAFAEDDARIKVIPEKFDIKLTFEQFNYLKSMLNDSGCLAERESRIKGTPEGAEFKTIYEHFTNLKNLQNIHI